MKTIAVNTLVDSIMSKYDPERKGIVRVGNNSEKKAWVSDSFSNSKLFEDVNIHTNQDGKVTKQELYYYIKTYDLNEDEKLTKRTFFQKLLRKPLGEYDSFANAYKNEIK